MSDDPDHLRVVIVRAVSQDCEFMPPPAPASHHRSVSNLSDGSRPMASCPDVETPRQVLVFLPAGAARLIVAKLAEHGHSASAIQTIADLAHALRSDAYSVAVTTRADIDVVRTIKPIPVVNIEVFFHTVSLADDGVTAARHFDGQAFIERIRLLKEPRRER